MRDRLDRYRTLITAVVIAAVVSFAGYLGYSHIADKANQAQGGVREIQQKSPCLAVSEGHFTRLAECRQSFNRGLVTLTPLQSCRFLQKGAGIIVIGGQPIPPVTCVPPTGKKTKRVQKKAEQGERAEEAAPGFKGNRSSTGEEATAEEGAAESVHESAHESVHESTHESSGGKNGGHEGGPTGTGTTGSPSGNGEEVAASPPTGSSGSGAPPAEGSSGEEPVTGPSAPPNPPVAKVELLPPAGAPVQAEVLPETIPLPVCTPVIKINCR